MRLIDADELKNSKRIIGTSNYCEYCVVDVIDIDKAPTVDAIPISVLEDIKDEIIEKCHGLATNIDEPYDEHDIIFADEVIEIIDKYISKRK